MWLRKLAPIIIVFAQILTTEVVRSEYVECLLRYLEFPKRDFCIAELDPIKDANKQKFSNLV